MADRSVRVLLSLVTTGFDAGMAKAMASVEKGTKTLEDHHQEIDRVGTAMVTAGGLMVAGVGVAIKAYADFDKQMSAVKSTGRDAVENFEDLRTAAIDAGTATAFSASEAAQGIEELAKAGLSARDILGGGLTGALDLAAAGTIGVGEAAEITSKTLKQFELGGERATDVADALAAGAGKATGEVGDLAQALAQSGTVAHQYGISMEETVGTLSLFAENALLGSDAGTSLKTMLLSLAQPTDKARDTLAEYNISAYDAQGNFVGLAGLAGQLSGKLGHLSQEQQNAALKTIFGSDAIRSATILMKAGQSGVEGWTQAVQEQGFAAEMAATKLDNLAGDLEALGGAFESAFINSASGANGVLRDFVQAATDAVNWIGQLPEPVLGTGLALAGIVGGGLLAAGMFAKVAVSTVETITAVRTLTAAYPALTASMRTAAGAAGILGIALATGAMVGAKVQEAADQTVYSLDQVTAVMRNVAKEGAGVEAANAQIQASLARYDGTGIDDIGGAFQEMGNRARWAGLAVTGDFLFGLVQLKSAGGQVAAEFAKMDQSLAAMAQGGNLAGAQAAFRKLSDEAVASGESVKFTASLFPELQAELRATATELGVTTLSAEDMANWMRGDIPPAIKAAANAARDGGKDFSSYAAALDESAQNAARAAQESAKLGRDMLKLSGSQIGFQAAVADATQAVKDNGKTLDIHTKKGRANQQALDDIAASYLAVRDNLVETGASAEKLASAQDQAIDAFLRTADAMGASSETALQLAADYDLIPDEVATQIAAVGATLSMQQVIDLTKALYKVPGLTEAEVLAPGAKPSKEQVDAFIKSVGQVPGLTEADIRTLADLYGVQVVQAEIAKVKDKTVTIRTNYVSSGVQKAVADGGMFTGMAGRMVQAYAAGGIHSIGAQQSQIRPAGGRGILWAEEGAGPWESFISGHPRKRARSRWIASETVRRLGGHIEWDRYADGGIRVAATPYTPPAGYTTSATTTRASAPTGPMRIVGELEMKGSKAVIVGVIEETQRAQASRGRAERGYR